MRNAQILMKFFLGSAPFTKWRKAGMLRLAKINIRKEKRPYVARKMCATQGLKFLSNLGLSQAARFCPFDGFRGCVRFPKIILIQNNPQNTTKYKIKYSLITYKISKLNHSFSNRVY